jgi:hypothetical protein
MSPSQGIIQFVNGEIIGIQKKQVDTSSLLEMYVTKPVKVSANSVSFIPCTVIRPVNPRDAYCLNKPTSFKTSTGLAAANIILNPKLAMHV